VLDFYSAVAEERDIQLMLDGEATIMADESLLRIALTNLVSNGLRFTPSGKSLRIHVERNSKQEVAVSVIDSGPGIAPEHYELIFDRYYRLEKSRSTEGAGLGLSIVQAIMKLHGGRAFVDRAADGGAIFTLVFPSQGNRSKDA
jgi:two-component system heavy metal sensor histidine kinase CusS